MQYNLQPGDLPPPAPQYCRVPNNLQPQAIDAGAQNQVFIAPPSTSHNDRVRAETWAQANNFAILPLIECWADAFTVPAVQPIGQGGTITTAVISSPTGGQVLSNPVSITGTVQFDGSQADFWHLDIRGGQFADWTPMGDAGYNNISNGQLFSGNLPAGTYTIRLRLSKDGQIPQTPYEVTITVQ